MSGTVFSTTIKFEKGTEAQQDNVQIKRGDTSYIHVYDLHLLAGRNLVPKDTADEYLINEKYLHVLGFKEPRDALGKVLNKNHAIVGVVKDFHTQSLRAEIAPTAIYYSSNERNFGVKLATPNNKVSDMLVGLEKMEKAWKEIYPDEKFNYQFMNELVKGFYKREQRVGNLARIATCIAVLLSCLGLFGLASFTVIQRTKEIGIRKVLGATVNGIMVLLSGDFLKLVLIAFIVSSPIAYYISDRWLQTFAYRTDLTVWIFLASGFASVVIAFITISVRTVNAAKADPVESLRYE